MKLTTFLSITILSACVSTAATGCGGENDHGGTDGDADSDSDGDTDSDADTDTDTDGDTDTDADTDTDTDGDTDTDADTDTDTDGDTDTDVDTGTDTDSETGSDTGTGSDEEWGGACYSPEEECPPETECLILSIFSSTVGFCTMTCAGPDDEETCTDISLGNESCILYNSTLDEHYCAIDCLYNSDCPLGQTCEPVVVGSICYPEVD